MTYDGRITGHDAIRYAEERGLTLGKYADPTEDGREGLSAFEAREIAGEDPSLIYVDAIHQAYRYAADGHQGEVGDGEEVGWGTLAECRDAIAERLGVHASALAGFRWDGTGDDVEAYHESDAEGCGGYAIIRVR